MLEANGTAGRIIFDGETVVLIREAQARGTASVGRKAIGISSISAVTFQAAGLMPGFIRLVIADAGGRRPVLPSDPSRDENAVVFVAEAQDAFRAVADAIVDAVAIAADGGLPGRREPSSVAGEIRQLSDLRHRGLLSDGEFDRRRRELFGRL